MNSLPSIKAAAREKLDERIGTGLFSPASTYAKAQMYSFSDEIIDLTYQSIKESVVPEKKEIGYEEEQQLPDMHEEIMADMYETKAEAWFAGWDNCCDEQLRRFKEMEGKEHPANCVACSDHGPHGPQEKA